MRSEAEVRKMLDDLHEHQTAWGYSHAAKAAEFVLENVLNGPHEDPGSCACMGPPGLCRCQIQMLGCTLPADPGKSP